MWSIKPIGQFVDELLIGNDFHTYCDSDLDLWPSDPNFNRGHLLAKANALVKYQANRSIRWRVIDRRRFLHLPGIVTVNFDLVTPISIGVIYWPRPMHMWSIKPIGQSVHKLLIENELVYRQTDWQTDRLTFILQNNRGWIQGFKEGINIIIYYVYKVCLMSWWN